MLSGFLKSATRFPHRTALIVRDKHFTYQWVLDKAQEIALRIVKEDVSKTNLVGLYTDNNEYTYAALIGILMANKGFVPLNHKFPTDRLTKIIKDSGVTTIVHCKVSQPKVQDLTNVKSLVIDDVFQPINETTNYSPIDDQIVYILFTSGSTGVPKGIPITNLNFNALIAALNSRYNLNEEDIVLQAFELSFDVSLACSFMAWQYGAALLIPDMEGIVAVNSFKAIYEHKATFVTIPPSSIFYLKKLKMLGVIKVPSVHTTLFTGEALPYKLVIDWKLSAENTIVENAYGPTETTVWCLFYKLDELTGLQTINGLCPIGETLNDIDCMIVDENFKEVSNGERGELLVAGKQIFNGYWNNVERTHQAFYNNDNRKWYKTGDIVVKNEHNDIVYINRKDNQVQVNGFRVELGEVEHALKNACGLDSLVVLAKSTDDYTDLYAFIEGNYDKENLLSKLKNSLPFYMIPRHFISVSPLPINTNGKVDKQLLHQKYLS